MNRPKDLLDFQDAKEYKPDEPTHKFFKSKDQWMVRCLKTKGSFSTNIWYAESYPANQCPCCNKNVK